MLPYSVWCSNTRTLRSLLFVLIAPCLCSGSNITYNVDLGLAPESSGSTTIVGDIVTDGKLGVLTQTDVISWHLQMSFGVINSAPVTFDLASTGTSHVTLTGSDLSATTTQLLFNFVGLDAGYFEISQTNPLFGLCFDATGSPVITNRPTLCQNVYAPYGSLEAAEATGADGRTFGVYAGESGIQVVGTAGSAGPSPVPEPPSWELIWSGFVTLTGLNTFLFRHSRERC